VFIKKTIQLLLLVGLACFSAAAQSNTSTIITSGNGRSTLHGSGAPTGSCIAGILYTNDVTGAVYSCDSGSWVPASGTGSGTVNSGAKYAPAIYPNAGTTVGPGCTPPATPGQYAYEYVVPSTSAVAPTCPQIGTGSGGGPITGATSTYLVLYSDNSNVVNHDSAGSAAVTVTLPTAVTLSNAAFGFVYENDSAHADTITPTTWTIDGAASLTVPTYSTVSVKVDPASATNWMAFITPSASKVVRNDSANAGAAGMTLDMSAATTANAFKVPVGNALTAGADGVIAVDSATHSTHIRTGGADSIAAGFASAPAGGKCAQTTGTAGVLAEASSACGSGTYTLSVTDLAPVAGDDSLILVIDPPVNIHLTRFACGVTAGTSVVANLLNGATSLLADKTCTVGNVETVTTTTWANGSSQCGGTTSCAISAHTPITLHVGTVTGAVTTLNVAVEYTVP